jgi:hypothetical protein
MKPIHWLLIAAAVFLAWNYFRDDHIAERRVPLNYDQVAVSERLTAEAQALDLSDDLDVSLLPDIGKQAIRDAAQQGLKEQAFLQAVLRQVSDRVHEISTIDLNGDGISDPILVKPEPVEGEQFVMLSLRVPASDAYPLPEAREAEKWKDLDTIEVATMTVALNDKALTVQSQGSPHLYPNAGQQHYVVQDTTPSFLSMYMTMRMIDWMFFPPMYGFWGPGWGYGYYQPRPLPQTASTRGDTLAKRGYERRAPSAESAVRGKSGAAPVSQYSRLYANQTPKAISQLRATTAFRNRTPGAISSGGFGRSAAGVRSPGSFSNRSTAPVPRSYSAPRPFSPSMSRPSFGGFGRGGMRFQRCHGCWRGPLTRLELPARPGLLPAGLGVVAIIEPGTIRT